MTQHFQRINCQGCNTPIEFPAEFRAAQIECPVCLFKIPVKNGRKYLPIFAVVFAIAAVAALTWFSGIEKTPAVNIHKDLNLLRATLINSHNSAEILNLKKNLKAISYSEGINPEQKILLDQIDHKITQLLFCYSRDYPDSSRNPFWDKSDQRYLGNYFPNATTNMVWNPRSVVVAIQGDVLTLINNYMSGDF